MPLSMAPSERKAERLPVPAGKGAGEIRPSPQAEEPAAPLPDKAAESRMVALLGKELEQDKGFSMDEESADSSAGRKDQPAGIALNARKAARTKSKGPELNPLARALELARAGQCEESLSMAQTHAESNPEKSMSSPIWLELSRCFLEKGKKGPALEMARKASEAPSTTGEAEALIQWIQEVP